MPYEVWNPFLEDQIISIESVMARLAMCPTFSLTVNCEQNTITKLTFGSNVVRNLAPVVLPVLKEVVQKHGCLAVVSVGECEVDQTMRSNARRHVTVKLDESYKSIFPRSCDT